MNDKPFSGDNAEEYNAVCAAINGCGRDHSNRKNLGMDEKNSVYEWLENTPRFSLIVELVDKLHELGYRIKK